MTNALSLFTLLFCATLGAGAALALALGECMGVRARAVKRTVSYTHLTLPTIRLV